MTLRCLSPVDGSLPLRTAVADLAANSTIADIQRLPDRGGYTLGTSD